MVEKLDQACRTIFGYFAATMGEKTRFNDLFRKMNALGYKMSRPTLSEHLKHLTKMELLKREEEATQRVTYRLNGEKWANLKETIRRRNEFYQIITKAEKEFKSYPIKTQLNLVFQIIAWRDLYTLKKQIVWEIDQKTNFETQLELLLLSKPSFREFERWIIEECKDDETFRTKMYEEIDDLMKEINGEKA
jgi:DNA-binding transcriptional ArsR family regulator